MITGIKWVSELIEIAGGVDVFSELSSNEAATDRIVTSQQVIKAAPDIIVASWCGKKVRLETIKDRDGWSVVPAVKNNCIFEKSVRKCEFIESTCSMFSINRIHPFYCHVLIKRNWLICTAS